MYANNMGYRPEYIHHTAVDGDTKYGTVYGFPIRNVVGGEWDDSTSSGSRGTYIQVSTAYTYPPFSASRILLYRGNDC